jgi:hypothetical protein
MKAGYAWAEAKKRLGIKNEIKERCVERGIPLKSIPSELSSCETKLLKFILTILETAKESEKG